MYIPKKLYKKNTSRNLAQFFLCLLFTPGDEISTMREQRRKRDKHLPLRVLL